MFGFSRAWLYAAIISALAGLAAFLRIDAARDERRNSDARNAKQYAKERKAIDNADTSQGDVKDDRDWLRDASERLSKDD